MSSRRSDRPLVLALSSYDPVRWTVVNQGGAQVAAVLLSGYHPSTVVGARRAPVIRIGNTAAFSTKGPAYLKLRQDIAQYANGRQIRSFQGSYTGVEFSVGP